MTDDENPLWTTEQTAEFLDFPVSTLVRWRRIRLLYERIEGLNEGAPGASVIPAIREEIAKVKGPRLKGPPFLRIGAKKVRYRKSDVIAWAEDPQ